MNHHPTGAPARRPALDGIRGFGATLVVLGHALPGYIPGGALGVDIFFVLSGYLITGILLQNGGLREFWARRLRRILPALSFALVGTAFLVSMFGYDGRSMEWRGDVLSVLTYTANWRMLSKDVTYEVLTTGVSPFAHLWSLAVEEQFYLTWPLLLAVPFFRRNVRRLSLVVIFASLAVLALLVTTGASIDRIWYGTDARAFQLCAGALLTTARPEVLRQRFLPFLASGLLLWSVLTSSETSRGTAMQILAATVASVLLVRVVETRHESFLTKFFRFRPLVVLGTLSYSIYLWHLPLLWALRKVAGTPAVTRQLVVHALLVYVLSIVIAAFSWRCIEAPLLRRGKRPSGKDRLALGISVCLMVSGGAGALYTLQDRGIYKQLRTDTAAWQCPEGSPVCDIKVSGRPDAWTCADPSGCAIYAPERPTKTVLLVGDSIMRGLTPAFVDEARDRGWRVVGLVTGCTFYDMQAGRDTNRRRTPTAPILQGSLQPDPLTQYCPTYLERLAGTLDRWVPDVVVAANGGPKIAFIPRTEDRKRVTSRFVTREDPEYAVLYGEATARMYAELERRDIPLIAYLMVEPALPPRCSPDRPFFCSLFVNVADDAVSARAERAAQIEAFEGLSEVTVFDPEPFVCPDDRCDRDPDLRGMRYDGVHYTMESARDLVGRIIAAAPPLHD